MFSPNKQETAIIGKLNSQPLQPNMHTLGSWAPSIGQNVFIQVVSYVAVTLAHDVQRQSAFCSSDWLCTLPSGHNYMHGEVTTWNSCPLYSLR